MQRIMIIGGPGSGKSTLARKLGDITGLPVTHIDQVAWLPGWEERPRLDTADLMHEIQAGECWIIDGQYSSSMEDRLKRADTIIFLDFAVHVRLWRVMKRVAQTHGKVRPDMADGCPEQFSWEFIKWIWNTRRRVREKALSRITEHEERKRCFHLRTNAEVAAFLRQL